MDHIPSQLRDLLPPERVFTSSTPEFKEYVKFYNQSLTDSPLAIIRPVTEDEVSRTLRFCSTIGIRSAVRSGGHDFFGRSLTANGVLLDMRRMKSVSIAPDQGSVRVGGGIIAGDLQEILDRHGLFTPTGQSKTVGYVSWACGGGYGFYVGSYGFGVDQILGAKVVTANGTVINTREDEELLWALRGAGAGTFGVVTELTVKVYPVPKLYAGYLAFALSQAQVVLDGFQRLVTTHFPDEFSGDALVAHADMLPLGLSEPCFAFLWCWTTKNGDLEPAKIFLRKMTDLGTVLANTVEETSPAVYGVGDSSSPTFFRSINIQQLDADIGAIFESFPPVYPLSAVVIHNNHGIFVEEKRRDAVDSCFANRFPHIILGFHGGTYSGAVFNTSALAEARDWVERLKAKVERTGLAMTKKFPSFCPPEEVNLLQCFDQHTLDRQLLTHTSGMAYALEYVSPDLVERVNGIRLGEVMQRHILQPLGISDMEFRLEERQDMRACLAQCYEHSDEGVF
ncbi:uncharacterized protein KD926_002857 [Aspergillus affinis]|uniref:uncharacterized protein n=1 Tax=Aspergillus affinis TaxID=1070780 RepID=UPI0022FF2B67|nr:uncharacterized protein KD926_002857 [Aspergillus affinis]KAI9035828.1 hypothetical protein KD926_002857 [Aspergillus affinis]